MFKVFLSRWFASLGTPSTITIDLGCNRICTTACHPTANGMFERLLCQLKASYAPWLIQSTERDIILWVCWLSAPPSSQTLTATLLN
ncbi:unnamed protein product [Dibothriocephalus latus]|uniref:Integrase catalytic domain-containing protein n=1 Tax=Dibothriocephalus latus TaxID=60516 RepID=A0A3P7MDU6_DIBLA|nr:unnamed protein product [Dibothriocephalus latus]